MCFEELFSSLHRSDSSIRTKRMESEAALILVKAVEKDQNEEYTMARILYEQGVQILINAVKETSNPTKKTHYQQKAAQYLDRIERLKEIIDTSKKSGTYRESIKIPDGATGFGYSSLMGRFLDGTVTSIYIEDPYIRAYHQCQNLVRFCELAVKHCPSLSKISLVTTRDTEKKGDQVTWLAELKSNLRSRLIIFDVRFSETLHDRQIVLSNGWVIKIGRGLDYFKAPDGKFTIGTHDLELRCCLETTVDIFHKT